MEVMCASAYKALWLYGLNVGKHINAYCKGLIIKRAPVEGGQCQKFKMPMSKCQNFKIPMSKFQKCECQNFKYSVSNVKICYPMSKCQNFKMPMSECQNFKWPMSNVKIWSTRVILK